VTDATADKLLSLLSRDVLPFLHVYRPREIDYAVLSSYVSHKLEQNEEIEQARQAEVTLRDRYGQPRQTLSARTTNMTLEVISRILDAVKRGMLEANPAADPHLRLKMTQRKGNFLEADVRGGATANGRSERCRVAVRTGAKSGVRTQTVRDSA